MRPIDADDLVEKIYEIDRKYGMGAFGDGLEMAKELVFNMPTIELDRPHGEWIHTEECDEEFQYRCSNCNLPIRSNSHHFCPNCGASMSANDRQVTGKLNSEIEKSKSEISPCIECCKIDNSEPCRKGCSEYQKWKEGEQK